MATVPKLLTLEEFLKLPEEKPALEFFEGEVTQKALPQGKHSALQGYLSGALDRCARPSKLARVFIELQSTFAGASLVPDVSVYLWDRVPRDSKGHIANEFIESLDLVVEIVSPDQSVTALVRRCLWFVDHEVRIALLVDPDDESVLLFRPYQIPRALREADRIEIDELLPSFELSAAELFASLQMD